MAHIKREGRVCSARAGARILTYPVEEKGDGGVCVAASTRASREARCVVRESPIRLSVSRGVRGDWRRAGAERVALVFELGESRR